MGLEWLLEDTTVPVQDLGQAREPIRTLVPTTDGCSWVSRGRDHDRVTLVQLLAVPTIE